MNPTTGGLDSRGASSASSHSVSRTSVSTRNGSGGGNDPNRLDICRRSTQSLVCINARDYALPGPARSRHVGDRSLGYPTPLSPTRSFWPRSGLSFDDEPLADSSVRFCGGL